MIQLKTNRKEVIVIEFSSIEEVIEYIRGVLGEALGEVGEDMKEIMVKAIQEDIYDDHSPKVYERTGQLLNTPQITEHTSDSITTEFLDNGDWSSVISGKHMFPIEEYQKGTVWSPGGGRYSADVLETAFTECQLEIPEKLIQILRSHGIPIE